MFDYTDTVKEHFLNPRNVGEIENPDGSGEVGSVASGDALKLTFKLDEGNRIETAKFMTFGGACAVAVASALTELIMGKTLEEAQSISNKEIADYLGGLPAEKMHCVVLGRQALEKAIESQRGTPVEEKKGEVICECFGITDLEIQKAVTENSLSTIEEITNYTKAGGGCKKCHEKILSLLETLRSRVEAKKAAETKPRLTNIRKIRLIEETIDREIRPSLRHDGGDIELIDVVGDRVLVATRGTCAACRAAERTLKGFVEVRLREMVSPELVVEEVSP